jgi:hypothetical protein
MAAADPTMPQSWNRYAYVNNDPLTNIDPNGLAHLEEDGDGYWQNVGDVNGEVGAGNQIWNADTQTWEFKGIGNDVLTGDHATVDGNKGANPGNTGSHYEWVVDSHGLPQTVVVFNGQQSGGGSGNAIQNAKISELAKGIAKGAGPAASPCFWIEFGVLATTAGAVPAVFANLDTVAPAVVDWAAGQADKVLLNGGINPPPGPMLKTLLAVKTFYNACYQK